MPENLRVQSSEFIDETIRISFKFNGKTYHGFKGDTLASALLANNIHLIGRNGMHKYNNQDHAMMTALLTVENILRKKEVFDIWNVNEEAEYIEAGYPGAIDALQSIRDTPEKIY